MVFLSFFTAIQYFVTPNPKQPKKLDSIFILLKLIDFLHSSSVYISTYYEKNIMLNFGYFPEILPFKSLSFTN